jgi:hypothetical protein
MATGAAPSSLRSIFEKFVAEAEIACAESRTRARYEIAEQLNQAVRRLRLSPSPAELAATLSDVASAFTGGLAFFHIANDRASSARHDLDFPLAAVPGFHSALESGDPVVAASTPSEVPAELPEKLGHPAGDRIWIFPVNAGKHPAGVLYCWGDVAVPVVELYTQVAGGVWAGLLSAAAPAAMAQDLMTTQNLISIARVAGFASIAPSPVAPRSAAPPPSPAPPAPSAVPPPTAAPAPPPLTVEAPPPSAVPLAAKRPSTWDDLPSAEQQIHLRAQRFARVHASTMRLNQPGAVQAGRLHKNLYEMLRQPIDEARAAYRRDFFENCKSMVDYLHLELVHTLANDDAEILGATYPGPLV